MIRFALLMASLCVQLLWVGAAPSQTKRDQIPPEALHAKPTTTDPAIQLKLVAIEPEIVTPTGLAVDESGRIWVVENHTHQRPPDYPGPKSDRIRVFDQFDSTGKAQRVTTFAEGFSNSMGLTLGLDGSVYLATRAAIYRLRDTKNAGTADEKKVLVRLDTKAVYPHNGLSGFTWDALGRLYFGFGENEGLPYTLVGSDGRSLSGGGEGGSIYRCQPDGSGLVRIATGFWNPFHLTFDAFGRLFAVDNDPDSRGPCRLLHIVEGGDYGYRYRNGRKGLHPFTAWNGELPGTLPMIAGTGEAPSGIVAYEGNALPEAYRGKLLTTSWGDHVLERFDLQPRGASFTAKAKEVARGGEYFRPVGIAIAPDSSCVISDWCDKSYPVHGKGRVWRLTASGSDSRPIIRADQLANLSTEQLAPLLNHPRQQVRNEAGRLLAHKRPEGVLALERVLRDHDKLRPRMQALWGLIQASKDVDWPRVTPILLSDPSGEVRAESVARLGEFGLLREQLAEPAFRQRLLNDPDPQVRMQALLQLDPKVALDDLLAALADTDPFLVAAAETTLGRPGQSSLLFSHIGDSKPAVRIRLLVALRRTGDKAAQDALPKFLEDPDPSIRQAAIQWVAEDRLQQFAGRLQASAAKVPVTRELFESLLAARQMLSGRVRAPKDEVAGEEFVSAVVADASQPAAFRALGLRLLRPDHKSLTPERLARLLADSDTNLRQEAARTLLLRTDAPAQQLLRKLAGDASQESRLRADAVAGLAASNGEAETQRVLIAALAEPSLQRDALRSLRGATLTPEVKTQLDTWWKTMRAKASALPPDLASQLAQAKFLPNDRVVQKAGVNQQNWQKLAERGGDASVGERVFFHAQGPRCYACHRIGGRGAGVGPDLTTIGKSLNAEKLADSILTPSREIAPQFANWLLVTRDGKTHSGVIVEEGPHSTVTLADSQGKLTIVPRTEIEERRGLPGSIMPDNLVTLLTPQDWVDLLAFLKTCR